MAYIDTFPDSEENPFEFSYYRHNIIPITDYASRNIVRDIHEGDVVLKMSVKIILRKHEGHCSDIEYDSDDDDTPNYISKKEIFIAFYFKIPDEFLSINGKILEDILDDDSNIILNETTERIFKEWISHSDCSPGSGCCNLYDTYIPISVEYVVIT